MAMASEVDPELRDDERWCLESCLNLESVATVGRNKTLIIVCIPAVPFKRLGKIEEAYKDEAVSTIQ